jgi:hypothetical protein
MTSVGVCATLGPMIPGLTEGAASMSISVIVRAFEPEAVLILKARAAVFICACFERLIFRKLVGFLAHCG